MATSNPYSTHQKAALSWIKTSLDVHNGQGSAAFYSRLRHPFKGWAPAYPETTGYLIPTLLAYKRDADWIEEAIPKLVDWLLSIQMDSGAFPALYANSGTPSVFNSGMILSGLVAIQNEKSDPVILESIQRTTNWIINQLAEDHTWNESNSPTYYTRVIWHLLEANKWVKKTEFQERLPLSLNAYFDRKRSNFSFREWGFEGKEEAFTHTIGYTLRGFWESAVLLNHPEIQDSIFKSLLHVADLIHQKGVAGSYQENWKSNDQFQCLPGNFQLAILAFRVGKAYQNSKLIEIGHRLIDQTLKYQQLDLNSNNNGGLPGSHPIYGPYMRFKYPNWGVKFLLDALKEHT